MNRAENRAENREAPNAGPERADSPRAAGGRGPRVGRRGAASGRTNATPATRPRPLRASVCHTDVLPAPRATRRMPARSPSADDPTAADGGARPARPCTGARRGPEARPRGRGGGASAEAPKARPKRKRGLRPRDANALRPAGPGPTEAPRPKRLRRSKRCCEE
jgi:hypothetical protein